MKIDVDLDTKALTKHLSYFERECIPKAESAALLRASRSALSRWVKGVAKQRTVKQALIKRRTSNRKIKTGRVLTMNGAPMPVSIMGPKGRMPKQTRNGVRVAGRHYPKGFIARNKLGKRPSGQTIFTRDGQPRVPISEERIELNGAVKSVGPKAVRRAIEQRYPKEFKHALDRCLKRRFGV